MYQGIEYLQNNTSPEEKVFSLPYNMLYNFLSERDNPSRYSEYMYLSGITDKDEYKIINDLEKNKVRIILVSQKAGPILLGVGFFGKTHCKILDKYIKDNYSTDICYSFNDKNIKRVAPICFYKRKTQFK